MKNLYLIGMMGCGKSTCAGILGNELKRPVLDTDHEIEAAEGRTVSEIFAREGETYFRDLETRLCKALSGRAGLIVATGGGLPLREENRRLLRESGLVIFLNRSPRETFDTGNMAARPLAQQGREDFLRRYAERLPLYRACAHGEITDFSSVRATVAEIRHCMEGQL